MALVWENLCCDDDGPFCAKLLQECTDDKNQQILTDLNGYLQFGELTALMGPSGSGKSTLLNCLIQGESYSGMRGRIAVASKAKMRSVLITQNERDHLLLNLTVSESLYYASELKNPSGTTRSAHAEIVKNLLNEMDLIKVNDEMVKKCSGGQRKRIAIALELTAIKKPNFLFFDEPTSGLDSHSGFNVVSCLRNLTQQLNIAVLTVIHQPSFEIFCQFHNLYILSKVGRCVFIGSPKMLQDQLQNYQYQFCSSNPADVIISIASCVSKEDEKDKIEESINFDVEVGIGRIDIVKRTEEMRKHCEDMMNNVTERWIGDCYANSGQDIQMDGLCSSGTDFKFYSLFVLFKRTCVTSLLRQKRLIFIRLALHVVVALVLTFLYNREIGEASDCYSNAKMSCVNIEEELGRESLPEENVKFQFFSVLFLIFAALMPTVLTFPAEIKLFINEHRNGWYSSSVYYISKTLMEIPIQLIFSFCYIHFMYWYSRQIDMDHWYNGILGLMSWRYGHFLGVLVLSCFVAQGLGFLIGIICVNNFTMAIILSSTVLLFQALFSGFFVKIADMNVVTETLTYSSSVRFTFESLLIILYGHDRCKSPLKSSIMFTFHLRDDDLFKNLMWIVGHLIAVRLLAFILLLKLGNPRILSTGLSCSRLFNGVLPKCQQCQRFFGDCLFIFLKIFAVIFTLQLMTVCPKSLDIWKSTQTMEQ